MSSWQQPVEVRQRCPGNAMITAAEEEEHDEAAHREAVQKQDILKGAWT